MAHWVIWHWAIWDTVGRMLLVGKMQRVFVQTVMIKITQLLDNSIRRYTQDGGRTVGFLGVRLAFGRCIGRGRANGAFDMYTSVLHGSVWANGVLHPWNLKLCYQGFESCFLMLRFVVLFLILRFFASLSLFLFRSIDGFPFRSSHFHLLTVHVDIVESSKAGTTQVENPIESTRQYNKGKTNQRLNPMNKLPGPLVRSPDPI